MLERRLDPREPRNSSVRVMVLGKDPGESLSARLLDSTSGSAGLLLPSPIPPGTLVRLDSDDEFSLGEVVRCQKTPAGFAIGVRVEQTLSNLAQLRNLFRRLDWFSPQKSDKEPVMRHAAR